MTFYEIQCAGRTETRYSLSGARRKAADMAGETAAATTIVRCTIMCDVWTDGDVLMTEERV